MSCKYFEIDFSDEAKEEAKKRKQDKIVNKLKDEFKKCKNILNNNIDEFWKYKDIVDKEVSEDIKNCDIQMTIEDFYILYENLSSKINVSYYKDGLTCYEEVSTLFDVNVENKTVDYSSGVVENYYREGQNKVFHITLNEIEKNTDVLNYDILKNNRNDKVLISRDKILIGDEIEIE